MMRHKENVMDIQLLQERLSHKSVKAYATKSKGIIGNVDKWLLD